MLGTLPTTGEGPSPVLGTLPSRAGSHLTAAVRSILGQPRIDPGSTQDRSARRKCGKNLRFFHSGLPNALGFFETVSDIVKQIAPTNSLAEAALRSGYPLIVQLTLNSLTRAENSIQGPRGSVFPFPFLSLSFPFPFPFLSLSLHLICHVKVQEGARSGICMSFLTMAPQRRVFSQSSLAPRGSSGHERALAPPSALRRRVGRLPLQRQRGRPLPAASRQELRAGGS